MSDPDFIPETQEDNDNDAVEASSMDDSLLNTTIGEDLAVNESQDFSLVDTESSQASQSQENQDKPDEDIQSTANSKVKETDAPENSAESGDSHNAVENAQEVEEKEVSTVENITIEAEHTPKEVKESFGVVEDDDDEIVEATPPDELFSPSKRQLLGAMVGLKRKADGSEELAAKILRTSEDEIVPETKVSEEKQSEALSTKQHDSDHTEKLSDANENDVIATNKEDESFQVLSQALESVLNDQEQMEVVENTVSTKKDAEEPSKDSEVCPEKESGPARSEKPEEEPQDANKSSEESPQATEAPKDDNLISTIDIPVRNLRQSIELIYEKALAPPKPQELVEIDESGEKIVLDSSQEDPSINTMCKSRSINEIPENPDNKLTNGSDGSKKSDSDRTATLRSSAFCSSDSKTPVATPTSTNKIPDVLNLVSDSEGESSITEEKPKIKTIQVEKEFNVLLKLKCLVHVDESSKDIVNSEFTSVHCDNAPDLLSSRRRNNSDTSALADISDSKDPASPGSVTSNPQQHYPLPSRFSLISVASSSSSSSSGSSKNPEKDKTQFSLPRGVPKHAKKLHDSQLVDEVGDKLKQEFVNIDLLTSTVLKFVYNELHSGDLHNGTNDHTDSTLERFTSSTPEASSKELPTTTSKSTKRGRATKRTRSQNSRTSKTNGVAKLSPQMLATMQEEVKEKKESDNDQNNSLSSSTSSPTRQISRSMSSLRSQTPSYDPRDVLVGKTCFARWTDKHYYPGVVIGRTKSKLKVNFLDGQSKLLLDDFVVPCPKILCVGLSVYAATEGDNVGSCGMIIDVEDAEDKKVMYTVVTDENEKLTVPINEIFLSEDQVEVLREKIVMVNKTSPSTPQQLGKISLDNLMDGSRRNKSPVVSTPKSARSTSSRKSAVKRTAEAKPSSSGIPSKIAFVQSESDSNVSVHDNGLGGVHPEVAGTSGEFVSKGPQSRMKGKARSKKKQEDPETIATVGPIPEAGSTLFKGMNFMLTCAPLESLDRYKADYKPDSNSEVGTEYEEEWTGKPFIRERLISQIIGGGGKVFENFDELPVDEYKNARLITNVPNATERSLLCLSAGIRAFNHQWIIRCCQENRVLDMGEEELPAGWSLDKKSYVEFRHRKTMKPFNHVVVVIPKIPSAEQSLSLWQKIIENAGGKVQFVENPTDSFSTATVVLTNKKCPSWVKEKANGWTIPLVSTTWIVQCLVEGWTVPYDTQAAYLHNYTMN